MTGSWVFVANALDVRHPEDDTLLVFSEPGAGLGLCLAQEGLKVQDSYLVIDLGLKKVYSECRERPVWFGG